MPGHMFEIGADYETGEVRVAATPEYDPLDPFTMIDPKDQWVRFVSPLKRLKEILQ